MVTSQELQAVKNIPGQILGNPLRNKLLFVVKERGQKGLAAVEELLTKWGFKITLADLKDFTWYPEVLDIMILIAVKEAFDWPDDKLRQMGRFAAKISIIARLMMKYFVSIARVAKEVGEYWKKYRTVGRLFTLSLNESKKQMVLELEDFTGHPLLCRYLEGYFYQIASYVILSDRLEVKEITCLFKDGRKSHRYQITW